MIDFGASKKLMPKVYILKVQVIAILYRIKYVKSQ